MANIGERRHFKAPDLKRLLATLQRAGIRPGRIEVTPDGRIAVTPAHDGDAPAGNEWDVPDAT